MKAKELTPVKQITGTNGLAESVKSKSSEHTKKTSSCNNTVPVVIGIVRLQKDEVGKIQPRGLLFSLVKHLPEFYRALGHVITQSKTFGHTETLQMLITCTVHQILFQKIYVMNVFQNYSLSKSYPLHFTKFV